MDNKLRFLYISGEVVPIVGEEETIQNLAASYMDVIYFEANYELLPID